MTGRVFEILACLFLALAVHAGLLLFIALPQNKAPGPGLSLTPASPDLAALVDAWDSPPETAMPEVPTAPTADPAPRPPVTEALTPVRTPVPRAPAVPNAPALPPAPDAAPRLRPAVEVPQIAALPALTGSTATPAFPPGRLTLAPDSPRHPAPRFAALAADPLPSVDPRPAAPPPRPPKSVDALDREPIAPAPPTEPAPDLLTQVDPDPSGTAPPPLAAPGASPLPPQPQPDPAPPAPSPAPQPEAKPQPEPQPAPEIDPEPQPVPLPVQDPDPIPQPIPGPSDEPDPIDPATLVEVIDSLQTDPLEGIGPPTAQAPETSPRPIGRPAGFRPGPYAPRPVARPADLALP